LGFMNPIKFYVDLCYMYIFLGRAFKRTMRLSNSLKVKNLCRKRGGGDTKLPLESLLLYLNGIVEVAGTSRVKCTL